MGPSPLGWPEDLQWEDYAGTTRSKLKVPDITRIIIGMLRAVDIDPATFIVADN